MTIGQQVTYRSHPHMSAPEARIVEKLVDDLLAAGLTISVVDGAFGEGERVVNKSADKDAIWAALASTDSDRLDVYNPNKTRLGWIVLIWGNDVDVISDYSTSLSTEFPSGGGTVDYMAGANALAEQIDAERRMGA